MGDASSPWSLHAELPAGMATYSLRHGHYAWKPGAKPITQLYPDWDIFWVRRGVAQWEFPGMRPAVVKKDQFLILPPLVAAVVSEVRSPLAFSYCHFGFRPAPTNIDDAWRPDFRGAATPVRIPLVFSRADAPAVWRAYRDLVNTPSVGDEPWRLERALVTMVAHLISFARQGLPPASSAMESAAERDPRVETLCMRIAQRPEHPWRVESLAASVGLSPGRLNTVFRGATGTTLKHYIVTARLRLSLCLLREHSSGRPLSVRAISEACGFSSQHFFSRQFRSYFALSPLAYRNGGMYT